MEEIAQRIFEDKLVSTGNFVKQFCEITGKSIPTAKRAHANLIKFDLIEKCNGVYRLKITHWFEMTTTFEGMPVPEVNEGIEKVAWLNQEQIKEALTNSYENIKLLFE